MNKNLKSALREVFVLVICMIGFMLVIYYLINRKSNDAEKIKQELIESELEKRNFSESNNILRGSNNQHYNNQPPKYKIRYYGKGMYRKERIN